LSFDLSVVIPLFNEDESLAELHSKLRDVTAKHGISAELIFVDDGSKDDSWEVLKRLKSSDADLKAVRFMRNYGKSAALNTGFSMASGAVVITMDADLQDSPDEIPELMKLIKEDGYDLVSGWKKKRFDPISKTLPTKLYNWATRKMSGIDLHDFNCGLKAYKLEVVQNIEVFGEMHRYIPVIAHREGYTEIGEKEVAHSPRKYGVTKFGYERFINGFLDLLTITFISRFGKKPMHLFGTLGTLMFLIGFFMFAFIGGSKLYYLYAEIPAKNIAEQSSFFIALTAMVVGTQLFLAGFLGELISRNAPHRNLYQVREKI